MAWVGRLDQIKRIEFLFEIADRMRDVTFKVAAPINKHTDYAKALEAKGRSIPNIEWLGALPRDAMSSLYQEAACLCCTSIHEGFPNTFLEAWSHGTPVVSSFDPDDLIAERQLGVRASTVPEFVEGIRLLMNSQTEWQARSVNAVRYYRENHSPEAALPRFEATLLAAWAGKD